VKSSRPHIYNPTIFALLVFTISFMLACQRAQLAEYHKFANDSEVPRITQEDAKKEYDAGTAIFVDSRALVSYDQEHVKGAISIPNGTTDDKMSSLPKNKKIIVYCS
jgi:hypothetical protein